MNKNNNKFRSIQKIGLSDKETSIYLSLLEIGKGSVLEISRKSGVERATAYRVLEELRLKILVQQFKENGKNHWAALHPRYLKEYVQKKKRTVSELFPDLEAIYNLNEEKPKLSYFEGDEDLKSLTLNIIREVKRGGEILSFSAPTAAYGYFGKKKFKKGVEERADKQITTKMLIPSTKKIPEYKLGMDWKMWRHIKVVDEERFPFKASINIWNNKISLLTVKSHPIGVVVESKDLATTFRSIFELLWSAIPDEKEE